MDAGTREAADLKLMCVLAHPDDESNGTGGILARYAAEGVQTYLVTATRGEHGWFGDSTDYPGPEALGKTREAELVCAAEVLGLREVRFLDYVDGELDMASPADAVAKIVGHLRRVRPHVVVTFPPDGAYGHPDHIAICQFTNAAIVCAADAAYRDSNNLAPHRVSKFYYMADGATVFTVYLSVFGDIQMPVDGVVRRMTPWPEWAASARIDAEAHWRTVWQAVRCHQTQLPAYGQMEGLPEEKHRLLWGRRSFYRVFSLVNGGRRVETDLFEGLR
jgi:LmbE family N-acetylglucosaminyl deacetylase